VSTVVIFRYGMLPASETFIRNQGEALTRWRPEFVGVVKADSFIATDSDRIALPNGTGGRRRLSLTGASPALRRTVAGASPQVIHAHFGGDGWLISRTAERLGVPLVITLHGYDVTSLPAARGWRGLRYRHNLRKAFDRAALIIAVSEHIRSRAIGLGADPAKVRVHHTGVALPPDSTAIPAFEWDVLFVGRFVEKKGLDDLIVALARLNDIKPRVAFIGTGPLEPAIRALALEFELDASFLGFQPAADVSRHMAHARVFASPSKTAPNGDTEGLPTTILEAAGLGLPAVSTFHSGIPEAVVDGETGLLCAEGDRDALAANLRRVLTEPDLRDRLGAAARAHVEANFDLAKQTLLLEDLYDSVRPPSPARRDHASSA
jgi:glycosyltransferase involved in cell wall biosynthesis